MWAEARGRAWVGENLDVDHGIFNGRDERQITAAPRTGVDMDGEDAFE